MQQIVKLSDFGIEGKMIRNELTEKKVFTSKKCIQILDRKKKYCKICFKAIGENAGGYIIINDNYTISANSETVMEITSPTQLEIKLVISAESSLEFGELLFEDIEERLSLSDVCTSESDVLVIVPNYPSFMNLYYCAFAHSRNKEYQKKGLKIQVASINSSNWYESLYEIDGVSVLSGNYESLKKLLSSRRYKTIVTHFVDEYLFSIFDGYVYPTDELIFICHGPETVYRYLENVTRPYFTKPIEKTNCEESFSLRDKYVKKYSQLDNVEWVFVSKWLKEYSEEQQNITFKHSRVINNVMNEELFPYSPKKAEDRKKILIIRKFDNIIQHSIDQSVLAILELSRRDYFSDLTFEIYGDGDYYDILIEPLKQFENVHFHRTFIPNNRISEIHKKSGILLLPSRHDAHAVAMGEGASSGLVVVGSNVTSNPYFMQEDRFHTLADPEDPIALANIIERLYLNPDEFMMISRELSKFTRENFNTESTVGKEIALIKEKLERAHNEEYQIEKKVNDIPILTIVVPAYNVEKYIEKCVMSLLNHRNSFKTEIIIVNDGSQDNTLMIAKRMEKISKGIVKVVDKENGGHGSTINVGLEMAKGKYFRLVDGDDWVDGENLAKLIDIMECDNSDLILTKGSYEYVETSLLKNIIDYDMLSEGKQYRFDDLVYKGYGFLTYGPLLTTANYKTELLRKANFKLSEKKPYVDMEFNSFSIKYIDTVKYYDLDIYRYLIGREGQTISREYWKKKYKDHVYIIFNILKQISNSDFGKMKKKYIYTRIISQMVDSQIFMYDAALAWNEIDGFLTQLKKFPEAYVASMNYIEEKKGNCQLILRKYKNKKGNTPIIVPGKYESIADDAILNAISNKRSLKWYVKKTMKFILPYGLVRYILQRS